MSVTHTRHVEKIVTGTPTSEGAGVNLTHVVNHDLQKCLGPFLIPDHFNSNNPDDYIAGFPDHPDRGFEQWFSLCLPR